MVVMWGRCGPASPFVDGQHALLGVLGHGPAGIDSPGAVLCSFFGRAGVQFAPSILAIIRNSRVQAQLPPAVRPAEGHGVLVSVGGSMASGAQRCALWIVRRWRYVAND